MRLLVVEDDMAIARATKQGLELEGYAVDVEHNGEDGYHTALAEQYDVIITDIMMSKMDGYEMIAKLRAEKLTTPILALTAKTAERDVVQGLDRGADDYLAKPFSFEVLLARIRALLRRPAHTQDVVLRAHGLEMNVAGQHVSRYGTDITLSTREFALLEYLLRKKNTIVNKDMIISHVWDFDADILPNTVEVFIKNLRKKLEKPFARKPKIIQTVRGFGYIIKDNA